MPLPEGYNRTGIIPGVDGAPPLPPDVPPVDPVPGPNNRTVTFLAGEPALAGLVSHVRNVVIKVTHPTSVLAVNGVITGTDHKDKPLTENWAVAEGGSERVFVGTSKFKSVASVTAKSVVNATSNRIAISHGDVYEVLV